MITGVRVHYIAVVYKTRFQEATIRGILYAQHDGVEDALGLRF